MPFPLTLIRNFLGRLRSPWLFALMAGLFLLDLLIPDPLPFVDEILLAMATILLSRWKKSSPP
ncbi:MAG: DUF6116 family protein [Lysobacterales bacterium]